MDKFRIRTLRLVWPIRKEESDLTLLTLLVHFQIFTLQVDPLVLNAIMLQYASMLECYNATMLEC